jgi:hypothetical protein
MVHEGEDTAHAAPAPAPEPVGSPRRKCIDAGGKWNGKKCIFPEPTVTRIPDPVKKPEETITRTLREEREGLTREQVKARQIKGILESRGEVGAAQALEEKQEEARQQAAIEAETERIRIEEFPTREDLDIKDLPGTKIPFVGGTFRAVTNSLAKFVLSTVPEGDFRSALQENLGVMSDEEINALAIPEIQKTELKAGLTMSESFGQVAEVVPGFSKLADWMDVETPRGNAEQVFKDIKSIRRQANKIASDVRYGYKSQEDGQQLIDELENYVNDKKGRLQLLIINSPSLNFNSDRINAFETDIFSVDNAIFDAKIEIAKGKIFDPSELQIYAKTQEMRGDNFDFITEDW